MWQAMRIRGGRRRAAAQAELHLAADRVIPRATKAVLSPSGAP
jgi:hypothetical protein